MFFMIFTMILTVFFSNILYIYILYHIYQYFTIIFTNITHILNDIFHVNPDLLAQPSEFRQGAAVWPCAFFHVDWPGEMASNWGRAW